MFFHPLLVLSVILLFFVIPHPATIRIMNDSTQPKETIPESLRPLVYGQTRTFIDLLKVMNEEDPIKDQNDVFRRLMEYIDGHRRIGGETARLACWLIRNWVGSTKSGEGLNLERLEAALTNKAGKRYFEKTDADRVYYRYCVAKLIHYIQFLNEFRRYIDWEEVEADLRATLLKDPCAEFTDGRYLLVSDRMLRETCWTVAEHWDEVTENGRLSNEKLEKVFFKDFQEMVESIGLDRTIEEAYTYQGCHPDWLIPQKVVGPFLMKSPNGTYDMRCGSSPGGGSVFEMRAAAGLLSNSKDFIHVKGYLVPIQDYSLPVYHTSMGKIHFATQVQKNVFINRLQMDYINNGH